MTDKEQIMIDGVDVKNCKGIDLSLSPLVKCKSLKFKTSDGGIAGIWCSDHTNCYFKQLARKTQECEQLQEKYEALRLENQEGYEIVAELKQKCEELKGKYEEIKEDRYNLNMEMYTLDRYRKALEEIEEYCDKQIAVTGDLPFKTTESDILDIINKAKDGKNE